VNGIACPQPLFLLLPAGVAGRPSPVVFQCKLIRRPGLLLAEGLSAPLAAGSRAAAAHMQLHYQDGMCWQLSWPLGAAGSLECCKLLCVAVRGGRSTCCCSLLRVLGGPEIVQVEPLSKVPWTCTGSGLRCALQQAPCSRVVGQLKCVMHMHCSDGTCCSCPSHWVQIRLTAASCCITMPGCRSCCCLAAGGEGAGRP
jgi:hypothetical protein